MPGIKQKQLSIIIISYNTKQITIDCLSSIFESLQGSNLDVEVMVIDNNSSDGSVEVLQRMQKNHRELRVIVNKENTGFGKANNQGVELAQAEMILLLNSDTIVLHNAIEKLYSFYQVNNYAFVGGKLLNQDLSLQASAGRFFSLPVVFAFLFLKGDALGLTRSSPSHTTVTDWVSGACIMTTKKIYQQLHGFDEGIFMYMEEVDLLYRGKKAGHTTGFYPEAQFIHLGSASSNKTYPILQVYRGLTYFYKKHHSSTARFCLKTMLQLKALVSLAIGILTGNNYLKTTYAEAYRIAQMD